MKVNELNESYQKTSLKLKEVEIKFESVSKVLDQINEQTLKLAPLLDYNKDKENIKHVYQFDKVKIIYPKTKIYRTYVPSNKKSWNISFENYLPVKFTSIDVINNINADVDLLNMKYLT